MTQPNIATHRKPIFAKCRALGLFWIVCGSAWQPHGAAFTNVTGSVGIAYNQFSSLGTNQIEPFLMTGGAAAFDFNADGWPDIFATRMDGTGLLFLNRNGKFEATPAETIGIAIPNGFNGASSADIDNDGDPDLYITTVGHGRNYLYLNQGGTFIETAVENGVDVSTGFPPRSGYSAAFGDFDRDGFLDLFTTSWGDYGGVANRLFRNLGPGKPGLFSDRTVAAGVEMSKLNSIDVAPRFSYGFAPRFVDLDGDRWPDLTVVADYRTSRLFWNNRNGSFQDGTTLAGVGTEDNGMGSTVGDFDGDGRLDWFVTSIFDPFSVTAGTGNRLFRNLGNRRFADATTSAGVREGGWGWGTAFFDYDNDGDLDLIMTNGINLSGPEYGKFWTDRTVLWRNNGNGTFTDVSTAEGIIDTGLGKGLLVLDYDRDGRLDVFIVNTAGQPVLYRNEVQNGNRWLKVKLRGTASNRDGIGAAVTLIPDLSADGRNEQIREVDGGSNYLGQDERILHFGLGSALSVVDRLIIRWPSGLAQTLDNVPANTLIEVTEASDFKRWQSLYFTQQELAGSAITDPARDPDADGLANLSEYCFGRDPRRAEIEPVLSYAIDTTGAEPALVLQFTLQRAAVEVDWTVETSAAASGLKWHQVADELFSKSITRTTTIVRLRLPISSSKLFVRLNTIDTRIE